MKDITKQVEKKKTVGYAMYPSTAQAVSDVAWKKRISASEYVENALLEKLKKEK